MVRYRKREADWMLPITVAEAAVAEANWMCHVIIGLL